jgi:hypothetical protein
MRGLVVRYNQDCRDGVPWALFLAMIAPALIHTGAETQRMDTVYVDIVVAVLAGECVMDVIEHVISGTETILGDIPIGLSRADYVVRNQCICHGVESSGYLVSSQPRPV